MLLDILRFTRGCVRFTIKGKYPERFINITAKNGVRLWNVKREDDGFSASMYMSDYKTIRHMARRSGVTLKITEKGGMPYLLSRYRDRVGLLIGAGAFLLTVFVMSRFIWSVEITGLDTISRSRMIELLDEHGIYVGAFKPSLDYAEAARQIMIEESGIGWMAINVTDSYASVEVKEEAPAPDVNDISAPCNVKAKRDGRLLRIEAYEGKAIITEGSGVIAGQLLVSGVMDDALGGSRLVHADARIIAETTHKASFSIPKLYTGLCPDGETTQRLSLDILGLRVPFLFSSVDSPFSVDLTTREHPAALGVTLPVGIIRERVDSLSEFERDLNYSSAKELLSRQSQLYESFALSDCRVIGRDYAFSDNAGVYTLSAVYTCEEDIAYCDPIGTDENTDLRRIIVPSVPDSP